MEKVSSIFLTFLFFIGLNFKKSLAFKRVMIKYDIMHFLGVAQHDDKQKMVEFDSLF